LSSQVNGPFAGSPRTSAEEQLGNPGSRVNFAVEGPPVITELVSFIPLAIGEDDSAANRAKLKTIRREIANGIWDMLDLTVSSDIACEVPIGIQPLVELLLLRAQPNTAERLNPGYLSALLIDPMGVRRAVK
jgi:hypothetical protein